MSDELGLWWIIPGALAGMPMPMIAPERFEDGGPIDAYEDDLPAMAAAKIGAVVCLLNMPQAASVYESVGMAFHCDPIPDGFPPSDHQAWRAISFIDHQRAAGKAVLVHCVGGLGRTGTILAAYLIAHGATSDAAIRQVREAEPAAIETMPQVRFLHDFARHVASRSSSGQTGKTR